jgi:acyl-CoA synthetase (AMP-forming)/AMP-acid ligase II
MSRVAAMRDRPETLAALLVERAQERGGQVAFGYLDDGEGYVSTLRFGELDSHARRIATVLTASIAPGGRVVLVYPPGLEFIAGIFGAWYAGLVPVPIYPPNPAAPAPGLARLMQVVSDCRAEAVLTTAALHRLLALDGSPSGLRDLPWVSTDVDDCVTADPADWRAPMITRDGTALIQYTSGSTSAPKGAVLTHGNLLANQRAINACFAREHDMVGFGWLPMYHDMGLIGDVLHPIYLGRPCYLMSPMHFLQKPVRWLRAIQRFGATYSGGPNFSYELCVRRISEDECEGLDLSSWQVAFCGAEPIRPSTLRNFAQRFAGHGFEPKSLYPCYGLAESSLLVTGARSGAGWHSRWVDKEKLSRGWAIPVAADNDTAVEVISSGYAAPDTVVAVAELNHNVESAEGEIGEIWISGPSVARGYWGQPELTKDAFNRALPGRDETFLRTADLGFKIGDELFVTGRVKDMIIVNGRNIFAQDVESTVQDADPRLRAGCGAAFAVESEETEAIAVVQETGEHDPDQLKQLAKVIRRSVVEAHQVDPAVIVLTAPKSLPKTTSGKIRRSAARTALLTNSLPMLAQFEPER